MMDRIKSNLNGVKQRIEDAAKVSGRDSDEIALIGVTKYVDAITTRTLFEAGCENLGESRPQVLWQKSSELADCPIRWHMIGHLQRNKVKRTISSACLIHSVDSLRLIDAIDGAAEAPVDVLLEVNVSGESAKHGLPVNELATALKAASAKSNLKVKGLMCMAGLQGDLDDARREFAQLRTVRDNHVQYEGESISLKELSMGMSGDFEVAIEEGATMVRVGSLLFEGVR